MKQKLKNFHLSVIYIINSGYYISTIYIKYNKIKCSIYNKYLFQNIFISFISSKFYIQSLLPRIF